MGCESDGIVMCEGLGVIGIENLEGSIQFLLSQWVSREKWDRRTGMTLPDICVNKGHASVIRWKNDHKPRHFLCGNKWYSFCTVYIYAVIVNSFHGLESACTYDRPNQRDRKQSLKSPMSVSLQTEIGGDGVILYAI